MKTLKQSPRTSVAMVTLGCARNDVDSEELAARLDAGGFRLVPDATDADVIVVNTCGFIDQAKKDSIDTLLEASDQKANGRAQAVVAVGCMAERYGDELAEALPEADAVLSFDDYPDISKRLRSILAGGHIEAHKPQDRRTLLPLAPIKRSAKRVKSTGRRRLTSGPYSPLKIASGCDRRCAFCAIPAFRGSYISRSVEEVIEEAEWLVQEGVKEVMLVSENTSSYGKDLGDRRGLIKLLRELNDVPGLERVRVSYLQPAEIYPGLLETMASLEHVMSYFDISFQHASASVLRRMRRFGDEENFLKLLETVRQLDPQSGARSNFIVGFPGETEEDFETLCDFVQEARLDVMGVFAYSDEEGTEGEKLEGHLPDDVIADRTRILTDLVTQMMDQRAAERVGEEVSVLIESLDENSVVGRAEHQGPEVDGETRIEDADPQELRVGDIVKAKVVDSFGADLVAKQG